MLLLLFTIYCQVGGFKDDDMIEKNAWSHENCKDNSSPRVYTEGITENWFKTILKADRK